MFAGLLSGKPQPYHIWSHGAGNSPARGSRFAALPGVFWRSAGLLPFSNGRYAMKQNLVPLLLLILPVCGLAQMTGVVMQVDIDNWVDYNYDVPGRTTWAQSAGPTVPAPPAFGSALPLADIV